MRILYWVGHVGDKFGGFERYNTLLAEKCSHRGHQIVMVHENENTVPEYNDRLKAVNSRQIVIGSTYKYPLSAFGRAVSFVRSWRPHIAHVHFASPLSLPLLKMLGVPLIYQTWHNSIDHDISLRTRAIRFVGKHCTTRMLAVSERVRCDEIRAGVPPAHIKTLYLGLPLRDFAAHGTASSDEDPGLETSEEQKIIITVARFYPQKGMKYVVEAALQVLRQNKSVSWWLVGDGPERPGLEDLVKRAGLSDRILFLGVRNDVSHLMGKSYVHVLGSLYEGLGLVALEASAVGVPTIGTQIGGLDEAVIDGGTGILVPKESSKALAQAVVRLLDNRDLRDRLATNAKRHVMSSFDSERLVDELLDLYETDLSLMGASVEKR